MELSIDAEATYDPVNFNYPHGTHLCAMEVDTETGAVKMRKYTCCDDIGTIINPLIVAGQVHGGLVQGIAQALWEEAVHDEAGTLVSGSFVDYLLPTVGRHDLVRRRPPNEPSVCTTNSLGTKGVGEAGTIASTPAVVNAVVDAVRHLGSHRHPDALHPRAGVARDPGQQAGGRDRDTPGRDAALRRRRPQPGQHGRSRPVIPVQFDYLAPTSVEEALAALGQHGDDAKIMAGGQSLLPVLRMRLNAPEVVIDLGGISSLRGIRDDGDALVIGAMTTHHDVRDDSLVKEHALLLSKAAAEVADSQIRHRGTFGGALAHADPAGDLGAPALALGAQFVIAGPGGTRTVDAADFFVDLFETAIGDDEILTEVRIPKHTGWGAHYEKFVRVAHQWPIVAVAATVKGSIDRGARGADQHGVHAAAGDRHRAGPRRCERDGGRRTRGRRSSPPRGPTRPRTSTAPPTTASTSRGC